MVKKKVATVDMNMDVAITITNTKSVYHKIEVETIAHDDISMGNSLVFQK